MAVSKTSRSNLAVVGSFHNDLSPATTPTDLGIVSFTNLCQFKRTEVTVTKPIEEFIEQQLAKGYSDAITKRCQTIMAHFH